LSLEKSVVLVSSLYAKWGPHRWAEKARADELAGILERGRGTGRILQEPGRSCVWPADYSQRYRAWTGPGL